MIYNVIGLMSGTSLDGLDIAFCRFLGETDKWSFQVLEAETIAYSPEWKKRLSKVENTSALEFIKAHTELGRFMGQQTSRFIQKYALTVDFIASHGHTIFHQPALGFSTQIGDGNSIVAETGLPVVCDFRSLDVAFGGQGAPLVPIGDEYLFHDYDFCLNLGGIANISYSENGDRVAFDISPCNMALNELAQLLQLEYDPEGQNARKGVVDFALFNALNALEFYNQPNPKSLGKEWYLMYFQPLIISTSISVLDKLRTVTEHIAYQITQTIIHKGGKTLIVTGGGAFNRFLIERLQSFLQQTTITIPDKLLVNYKEALIFAFLGVLRFRQEMNCLPKVTGAKRACSGGSIMGRIID